MDEINTIIIFALISVSFVILLDEAFVTANEPAKHLVVFIVNNTNVTVPFDCDPQYFLNTTALQCTNGEIIRP